MKRHLTLALASLSLAGSAFSQADWGSAGAVTVALTLSWEEDALRIKDETGKVIPITNSDENMGGYTSTNSYSVVTTKKVDGEDYPIKTVDTEETGTKIATMKWGNANILAALVEMGEIEKASGWSLVMRYDADGAPTGCVARQSSTKNYVDVSESLAELEFTVSAITEKTVTTSNTPVNGEETGSTSHTYSETYKGIALASIPFYGEELALNGLLTGSAKLVVKTEKIDGETSATEVYVPGAIKLDKLVGVSPLDDLVEGTVSIGAAAVVDYNKYDNTDF